MTLGDHVKEMLCGRRPQPCDVIRGRRREAALNDHAVAAPSETVTRRAENPETLLTTLHQCGRYRWRLRDFLRSFDVALRYDAFWQWLCLAAVRQSFDGSYTS